MNQVPKGKVSSIFIGLFFLISHTKKKKSSFNYVKANRDSAIYFLLYKF